MWLERTTQKSPAEWMWLIQHAIRRASYRPKWTRRHALETLTRRERRIPKRRRERLVMQRLAILKQHDTTNVPRWLGAVAAAVGTCKPPGGLYDENMRAAAIFGYVLLLWVSRVQRAKAYDPNRPVKLRQKALERWMTIAAAVSLIFTDERYDAAVFPGQQWDAPFAPQAKSGKYV